MVPGSRSARPVQHLSYRPAVDGLRGVAVLAVLAFHAFPEHVPGGFVGVDVFFVISGFLITGIIALELTREEFSFANFYMRRVRRLFPALMLVLAACLIAGWMVLLPDEFAQLGKHVGAAALFVANVALWRESGYFDAAAELKPLLHLWSLGIEEQFYLLWPVLLVALWRRRALLFAVLAMLVVASFALSVILASHAPVANFYLPFSRFWELGLGCLLALVKLDGAGVHSPSSPAPGSAGWSVCFNVAPVVGCAFIVSAVFLLDVNTPFPSWPTLLPVVGALLILGTPETVWFQRRALGAPWLVSIGLMSYALYLWHWPLLSFATILEAGPLPIVIRWLAVLLSFVLAWLTYRLVEVPIRQRKQFKIHAGLLASGAVAALAGLSVHGAAGFAGRFHHAIQELRPGPRVEATCRDQFPADWRFNYCRATSSQPPEIVVLGDSRAQAVYEGAAPALAELYPVMLLARGGCPPILNVRIHGYDPNEAGCNRVWTAFVRYIHQVRPPVVVLVGNGSFLLTDPKIRLSRFVAADEDASKEDLLEQGMSSLLRQLTRTSMVIHVGEIPEFETAPACFLRPVRLPTTHCSPTVDRSRVQQAMRAYNDVLHRVQESFPQVIFLDSVDVLCQERVCSQRSADGRIFYSDPIHLSPAGGRFLVENSGLLRLIMREAGRPALTTAD